MDSLKNYLINYEKYFSPLVDKKIVLLELGVYKGDSVKFWCDYFPNGTIIGVDINQVEIEDHSGRIHFFKGSQCDECFLDSFSREYAPYDIIIDDASHVGEFTKISFWHLFNNYLKPGGIFIIEDWGTGYYNKFPDGKKYKPEAEWAASKLRKWLDIIIRSCDKNFKNWTIPEKAIIKLLRTFRKTVIKKKFRSHNKGLVGFIKELVDEMGMDIITSSSGNPEISSHRKFERMEIFPGQIFIIKR